VGECLRLDGHLDEARSECLAGLEAVEQSDHMFRDSFRCAALCSLARTAIDQGDLAAARAAAHQVSAQLKGRPRTLGGGFYHAQALALLAWADADPRLLDEALAFFRDRPRLNFDALWFDGRDTVLTQLGRAAGALGRRAQAHELIQEAAALGSYEAARILGD
jgi:tetratricopeptide (TPR) repeat protein